MSDTTSHEKLVNDWYALFNGDFSKLDVAAESVEFIDLLGEAHGREELEGFIREMYTVFPDLQLTVTDMVADDDLIMVEWTVSGTHEGELNGIPPTIGRSDRWRPLFRDSYRCNRRKTNS